jgi:hypothetical protein
LQTTVPGNKKGLATASLIVWFLVIELMEPSYQGDGIAIQLRLCKSNI